MRPAANSHQIDRSDHLGFDQWTSFDAGHRHGELGEEPEAEPGDDHRLHPVVPITSQDDFHVHALLSQNGTGVLAELTVGAVDVTLVVKIAATHGAHRGEAVLPADGDDEPLGEQGQAVKPLVDAFGEP
jgi:hypothetical protein